VALPEHLAGEESLADEAADKTGQSRQYHASDGTTHCDAQVPPAPTSLIALALLLAEQALNPAVAEPAARP